MARAPLGRQQLLDAAREELIRGNGTMELAALTRRSGLSTGALYHHFGSKTGLLTAVYDAFYRDLARATADYRLPEDADWAVRERERTRLFVSHHLADALAPIMLDRSALDSQVAELEASYIQSMSADAARNIRDGQRLGQLPKDLDPDNAGAFIVGGLRYGIAQQLRLRPVRGEDEITDTLWLSIRGALGMG